MGHYVLGSGKWWLVPIAAIIGISLYVRLSTMIAKGMALLCHFTLTICLMMYEKKSDLFGHPLSEGKTVKRGKSPLFYQTKTKFPPTTFIIAGGTTLDIRIDQKNPLSFHRFYGNNRERRPE